MIDTYKHKGLRQKLVEILRLKGISDERVLAAINKVPRHHFMDSGFVQFSYKDQAFPIAAGQTISQPYTVAFQSQLLDVKENMKVLEVGTGSGYQTAVLIEMGAKVYTIERQKQLYLISRQKLAELRYGPVFYFGDGYEGIPAYSPFDRILITAGAPDIPEKLFEQLKTGGKMVIPVGNTYGQKMKLVEKNNENSPLVTEHGDFIFVPLLKGTQ